MKRSRLEIELKQLGSISNFFLSETVQAGGGMNKPAAGRATISASQCGCAKGPGWLTERKHLMMSRLGVGGVGGARSAGQTISRYQGGAHTFGHTLPANRQTFSLAQPLTDQYQQRGRLSDTRITKPSLTQFACLKPSMFQ